VLPFSTAVLGRYALAPVALAIYGANLAACTSTLAGVWFVADHSHITERPTASQRRYIVRRFGVQLIVALLGIACAFLAPALALSIFVALPIVFALTYHRGTTDCRRPPRRATAWRSKWASRLSGVREMGVVRRSRTDSNGSRSRSHRRGRWMSSKKCVVHHRRQPWDGRAIRQGRLGGRPCGCRVKSGHCPRVPGSGTVERPAGRHAGCYNRADAEAAVRDAVDRFGRIDVLVNNAASFYAGYFEELTPEQFDRQLARASSVR